MRILKHHCNIFAQRRKRILADIFTVYCYASAVGIIKAAEQVGNGGLAGAGRTDKRDLLSGHCMQRNIVQNRLVGTIAEANILEHNIAGERNIAGYNAIIVPLGLLVHHRKNSLRARKSGKYGRHLHRNHIYRHRKLTRIVCKDGQRTGCESADDHKYTADTDRDCKADLRRIAHDRPHNAAEELRACLLLAQIAVDGIELLAADLLVIKDLNDLLSRHSLLNITVDRAECFLLPRIVSAALTAYHRSELHKYRYEADGDKGELPARRYHENKGSD